MNKSVLLIGGSGFIGTRLIELLGEESCKNLDKRMSDKFPGITIVENICNKSLINSMPNADTIVLLAAEHHDNVLPVSLYQDVNVKGTQNVLEVMEAKGIKNIIFTSTVAVYGLNKDNPDETHPPDPFNDYSKTKWQAEELLRDWYNQDPENRSLTILRPSVIFGEGNRGNVYNLLKLIATGRFIMIGKGENLKSMAYVGNIVAFIKYCLETMKPGYRLFNYSDKPDLKMKELLRQVETSLNRKRTSFCLPGWLGYAVGSGFDSIARISGKKFPVSAIRIKKFLANTQFDSTTAHSSGFKPPYTLSEGLHSTIITEFINQ